MGAQGASCGRRPIIPTATTLPSAHRHSTRGCETTVNIRRSADLIAKAQPETTSVVVRVLTVVCLFLAVGACEDSGAGPLLDPEDAGVFDEGIRNALDSGVVAADSGGRAQIDATVVRDAAPARDATVPLDMGFVDSGVPMSTPDPAGPGPYLQAQYTTAIQIPGTTRTMPIDCRYPAPNLGPLPLVLIGHGFQIPADQYASYAVRLATFGYVACIADFEAGLIANHLQNTTDFIAGIDGVLAFNAELGHPLEGRIDPNRIGAMGHSLGGKIAVLAATVDARIRAVFGIDPVDGGFLCDPIRCPDASALLPLNIPVGVIGETLDASGGVPECAPAADNFQTFYEAASSPALEVDVLGASHMSFVDDPAACGLPCALCVPATASQQDVLDLARAMTAAFFERFLKGDLAYATYLDGAMAQSRYVSTGRAVIRSK